MNRKIAFVTQTFRVLSGNLKGNWVSMWGDYTFTDAKAAKQYRFPFQYTASVANGKITSDRVYYDALSILTQLGFKVHPTRNSPKVNNCLSGWSVATLASLTDNRTSWRYPLT